MKVSISDKTGIYGPGVDVTIDGDELALAIETWLMAHDVRVYGARTIIIDEDFNGARVYVDPSAYVIHDGKRYSGRGDIE